VIIDHLGIFTNAPKLHLANRTQEVLHTLRKGLTSLDPDWSNYRN